MLKKTLPVVSYLLPIMALAQGVGNTIDNLTDIVQSIIPLVIGLGVVYFLYGLMKYVTAGEGEEKAKARDIMIWGVIALFVMVSIWGLVNLLQDTLGIQGEAAPPAPEIPS